MYGDPRLWKLMGRYLGLSGMISAQVFIGLWLGQTLDERFKTSPWGLCICTFIACLSLILLLKKLKQAR